MRKLILLCYCCALTIVSQAQNWSLTGNSGTSTSSNFLGTTDNVDLIFKRNNIKSGVLGYNNLAFGQGALSAVTTGYNNIMYGTEAGFAITSGVNNVFVGFQSGMNATTASQNTFLGNYSGKITTTGASNTFLGYGAGASNTTGNSNVFIGLLSGRYSSSGSNNIFIGESSGEFSTTGTGNTSIGYFSSRLNTTGANNTNLGNYAGYGNTTGDNNTTIGGFAGQSNSTGVLNSLLGYNTFFSSTANYNTGTGSYAGYEVTTGTQNAFFGYNSGRGITTGSNNTIIGSNVTGLSPTLSNNIILADGSGNQRINIDDNGNTGIGIAAPLAKLHVNGSIIQNAANNIGASLQVNGNNYFSQTSFNPGISYFNVPGNVYGTGIGYSAAVSRYSLMSYLPPNADFVFSTYSGGSALASQSELVNLMTIQGSTGNVGIGTVNPLYKLTVVGNALVGTSNAVKIDDAGISMMDGSDARSLKIEATKGNFGGLNYQAKSAANTAILNVGAVGDGSELVRFRNISNQSYFSLWQPGYNKISAIFVQDGVPQLYLEPSGNIGINTSTPNTNAKLDVNGNIFSSGKILIGTTDITKASLYALAVNGSAIFTKAVVKLETNWPDYVFEQGYQLPTLKEVETYLKENKHLQGVPSADEVKTNGIDLGDNQAILLKKMEEMTLYMIELNKKVEILTKENETLRTAINSKNN